MPSLWTAGAEAARVARPDVASLAEPRDASATPACSQVRFPEARSPRRKPSAGLRFRSGGQRRLRYLDTTITIVTRSAGLVGAGSVKRFVERGMDVAGMASDMRSRFFGVVASTRWQVDASRAAQPRYTHSHAGMSDVAEMKAVFARYKRDVGVATHCGAQPSNDWAARNSATASL